MTRPQIWGFLEPPPSYSLYLQIEFFSNQDPTSEYTIIVNKPFKLFYVQVLFLTSIIKII